MVDMNVCGSGGRQCKTGPIPGLHVLAHTHSKRGSETHDPKTWPFPLDKIA